MSNLNDPVQLVSILPRLQKLHRNFKCSQKPLWQRSDPSLIVSKGKIRFTADLPIKTLTLCVLPIDSCRDILPYLSFSTGSSAGRMLQERRCFLTVSLLTKVMLLLLLCADPIWATKKYCKALMFCAIVNTTREGKRVHMAPTAEHQSHWNSVV